MKTLKYVLISLLALSVMQSCNKQLIEPGDGPDTPDNPSDTTGKTELVKLATPEVTLNVTGIGCVEITWTEVAEAAGYGWALDGGNRTDMTGTELEMIDLVEGEHTFTVCALAAEGDEKYTDSDPATVNFTIDPVSPDHGKMRFIIDNYTHDMARIIFVPDQMAVFTTAVIPAASATSDDAVIAAVEALPADKKYTGTYETVTWFPCYPHQKTYYTETEYIGLVPETEYAIVAISGDNTVSSRKFRTEAQMTQSQNGSVFPRGVSLSGGFIDVDKLGRKAPYCSNPDCGDTPLCWACVASSMAQYWLNDYAVSTGHEFQLKHPLPQTDYYATPIMDVLSQGMYHDACTPGLALRWFFQGFSNPSAHGSNDHEAFLEGYEYYHGGWGGFDEKTEEFISIYSMHEVSGYSTFAGKTKEQAEEVFGDLMLGWLRNGPVYFNIKSGHHALCAWGADFIVNSNGKKIITKLYITENDPIGQKNALEGATVDFAKKTGGSVFFPHITYASNIKADVGIYMPIRTWEALNGK